MTDDKALILSNGLHPAPVSLTINHVDSSNSLNEHIDSDAQILTAQLALLMQVWPQLDSLSDMQNLSDQVMKVLKSRRELCLKPTAKADMDDNDIDITPL